MTNVENRAKISNNKMIEVQQMLIWIFLLIIGVTLIALSIALLFAYTVFNICFTRSKDPEASIEKGIKNIEKGGAL